MDNESAAISPLSKLDEKSKGCGDALHLKILVPYVAAGAILGKNGSAIRQVQKDTGAKFKMSKQTDFYPGTTERVCLLIGTREQIIQTHNYVLQHIRDKREHPGGVSGRLSSEHSTSMDSPDVPVGSVENPPSSASGIQFLLAERHEQVKILVPNSTAGMIIGKEGTYIKEIKNRSGAFIQLSQKAKEINLTERCVIIAGGLEECKIAFNMILDKVAEDPQSNSCPNISYQDVMGPVASAFPTGSPFAQRSAASAGTSSTYGPGVFLTGAGSTSPLLAGASQTAHPALIPILSASPTLQAAGGTALYASSPQAATGWPMSSPVGGALHQGSFHPFGFASATGESFGGSVGGNYGPLAQSHQGSGSIIATSFASLSPTTFITGGPATGTSGAGAGGGVVPQHHQHHQQQSTNLMNILVAIQQQQHHQQVSPPIGPSGCVSSFGQSPPLLPQSHPGTGGGGTGAMSPDIVAVGCGVSAAHTSSLTFAPGLTTAVHASGVHPSSVGVAAHPSTAYMHPINFLTGTPNPQSALGAAQSAAVFSNIIAGPTAQRDIEMTEAMLNASQGVILETQRHYNVQFSLQQLNPSSSSMLEHSGGGVGGGGAGSDGSSGTGGDRYILSCHGPLEGVQVAYNSIAYCLGNQFTLPPVTSSTPSSATSGNASGSGHQQSSTSHMTATRGVSSSSVKEHETTNTEGSAGDCH